MLAADGSRSRLRSEDLFCCRPSDADAREAAEIVAAALSQLSADLREIVELKTYAGLTFQQISQVTGLPQGTVATRYRSALAKMRGVGCGRRVQAMMNDDIEQLLRPIDAPRRPPGVASAGAGGGGEPIADGGMPASPWLRRSALAVAASLLVGIAMNIGASQMAERRLAQLFGPPPVSKQAMELANAVEEVTDAQTAQWVYQRFAAPRPSGDGLAA